MKIQLTIEVDGDGNGNFQFTDCKTGGQLNIKIPFDCIKLPPIISLGNGGQYSHFMFEPTKEQEPDK